MKLSIISLLLAFLVLVPAEASASDRADPGAAYPDYVRSSFYVPVRDGTRLAMNIYRPAIDGRVVAEPLPVVFAFTPYRARYFAEDGSIVETGRTERLGLPQLTSAGYVVVKRER